MRPAENSGLVLERSRESTLLMYAMPVTGVEDEERARIAEVLDNGPGEKTITGLDAIIVTDSLKEMAALNAADVNASWSTRLRYDGFALADPWLGCHLLRCSNRAVRMLVTFNQHPLAAERDAGSRQELTEFLSTVVARREISKSRWQNLR